MFNYARTFIVLATFSVQAFAGNLPDEILNIPIPLISGENTSLAAFSGKKPVYIRFWASW